MSTKSLQEKFGAAGLKGGRAEEWLFNKLTHVYDEVIDLRKKKKGVVIELLKSRNYTVIDGDLEYKYLRTMTIDSLEEENMAKLLKDKDIKLEEYKKLNKTSIQELWLEDLDQFENVYKKYCVERKDRLVGSKSKKKKKKANA